MWSEAINFYLYEVESIRKSGAIYRWEGTCRCLSRFRSPVAPFPPRASSSFIPSSVPCTPYPPFGNPEALCLQSYLLTAFRTWSAYKQSPYFLLYRFFFFSLIFIFFSSFFSLFCFIIQVLFENFSLFFSFSFSFFFMLLTRAQFTPEEKKKVREIIKV